MTVTTTLQTRDTKPLRLTRLECTLLLEVDEKNLTPGYRIVRPSMPTRRAVSIEEFERDMNEARTLGR